MILNTAEKFIVLIQHPKKFRFIISGQVKNAGLIGSILLDLANDENLTLENGKIKLMSTNTSLSQIHKTVLEQIERSSRVRKIRTWISRFSRKSGKYQKQVVSDLDSKGIIKVIPKRFLGINYYRTQLRNFAARESIITELRDILFNDKQIENNNAALLGLMGACNIHRVVCKDRKELRLCRKKLKVIMKSDLIAQGVDRVIKEMQAAILAGIIASTVATSVSSS